MKNTIIFVLLLASIVSCKTADQSNLNDGNIARTDENGQIVRMFYGVENEMAVAYICSNQASSAFITLETCQDKRFYPGTAPLSVEQYKANLIRVVGLNKTDAELQQELQGVKDALAEVMKQQVDENVDASGAAGGTGAVGSFHALISDLEAKKLTLETEIQLRPKAQKFVEKVMTSFDKSRRDTTFASARFLSDHEYILAAWNETNQLPPLTRGVQAQINGLKDGVYFPAAKRSDNESVCVALLEKVDNNILSVRMASGCTDFGYFECKDRRCDFLRGSPAWKGSSFTFDSSGKIFISTSNFKDELRYSKAVNLSATIEAGKNGFNWGRRYYSTSSSSCGLSFDPIRDRNGQLVRVKVTSQNRGSCYDPDFGQGADLLCNTSKFMCYASHMQVIFQSDEEVSVHSYPQRADAKVRSNQYRFARD